MRPQYTRIQETPFTSERKMMEVRARPVNGHHVCEAFNFALQHARVDKSPRQRRASLDGSLFFVKGMPEKVLSECSTYTSKDGTGLELTEECKAQVLKSSRRMGASGLRVLALAYGPSLETLTFAGLCGMEDPPREGVADCVRDLRRGGVKVMMLTGDSKETAIAIARRCGILGSEHDDTPLVDLAQLLLNPSSDTNHPSPHNKTRDVEVGSCVAMSGAELDSMPHHDLANGIADVKVFYRVVPRLVLA